MQKLTCPRGGVSRLSFSPDGNLLAGLGDQSVLGRAAVLCWTRSRDWEVTDIEHHGPITGVAFHPSGRTLAYAAITSSMWETRTAAAPPRPATGPPPSVWRRRFAKESLGPFIGVHFHALTEVEEFVPNRASVPQEENQPVRQDNWARGLAFTPDGRFMLAAHVAPYGIVGMRTGVYYWHFTEDEGVWQLAEPTAARGETVNGGALIGGCLALVGEWGVAVCPVESPEGLFVPDVTTAKAVAVSPRGEWVATSDGERLAVWNLRGGPAVEIATAPGSGNALAFAPDGRTLAVGHVKGVTTFVDAPTGTVQVERDFGVGCVKALAYAPDGLTLAVGGSKGAVVVDTE